MNKSMQRKVLSINKNIYIIGEEDFDPKHIFENGQAFRWEENQGEYTVVANKYVIGVKKLNQEEIQKAIKGGLPLDLASHGDLPVVRLRGAGTMEDYEIFWRHYFDMDRDYQALRKELSDIDDYLKASMDFATGLRILKQDFFEMIISFIISANNNITRIKKSVAKLSERCGEKIYDADSNVYYKFPTPEAIAELDTEELARFTGVGYRAPYLIKTAQMIANKEVDLDDIRQMHYEQAHRELTLLSGVGPKVADCILLFGDSRDMAFPVDTWVIKVMNKYYLGEEKNNKKIKAEGLKRFGDKAGLAQQYLFYHARIHKVGSR